MSTPINWRHAPRTHTHPWSEVTGKPSTFTPAEHSHPVTDVTGLQAALDNLSWTTGWRLISPASGVTGAVKIKRSCVGGHDMTTIRLESVQVPAGTGSILLASLPTGFRHTGEMYFLADGRQQEAPSEIGLYSAANVAWMLMSTGSATHPTNPISGEFSWWSPDARPTGTLPGEATTI